LIFFSELSPSASFPFALPFPFDFVTGVVDVVGAVFSCSEDGVVADMMVSSMVGGIVNVSDKCWTNL
jgi:hypothetical protein